MKPPTVTFFGNFGTHNLGNECTLQAIIQNVRTYLPGAKVNCVCPDPQETSRAHGISAFPMSYRYGHGSAYRPPPGEGNRVLRFVRRLVVRLPREVVEWVKAYRTLRGSSMLVMTGTGMLGDFGIRPLDLHYEILKWSIVAKLRGCRAVVCQRWGRPDSPFAEPADNEVRAVARRLSFIPRRLLHDLPRQHWLQEVQGPRVL
jgi:polysaccharide pyruvyl transferase WcaK-like protein